MIVLLLLALACSDGSSGKDTTGVVDPSGDTDDSGSVDTGETGDTGGETEETGETDSGETAQDTDTAPHDNDGDGYLSDVDCDDENAAVNPGATTDLCNGLDDNCDGITDPDGGVSAAGATWASVQEGIDAATEGDTVYVCAGTWGPASINKSLSLVGVDDPTLVGAGSSVVEVTGDTVVLQGLRLTGGTGYVADDDLLGGGVIAVDFGSLTMTDCTVTGNSATHGGGIYAQGESELILVDTEVSSNTASAAGGGVYISSVKATVTGGIVRINLSPYGAGWTAFGDVVADATHEVSDNVAEESGGGVYVGEDQTWTGGTFVGNSAGNGGGIYVRGSVTVTDAVTESNEAENGGGLYSSQDDVVFTNVTATGNTATYGGGALFSGTNTTLDACTFLANTAGEGGGGLYVDSDASVTIVDGWFSTNAANAGGGIFTESPIDATGSTIEGGTATSGGGVYLYGTAATWTGGTVSSNTAENGGGIFSDESDAISSVELRSNTASEDAGGLMVYGGTCMLTGLEITSNTADSEGAGIYANNATLTIDGGSITSNTASERGGGGVLIDDSTVTLLSVDLGEDSTDNDPDDLRYNDTETYYTGYGAGTSLVCDLSGCN